MEQIFNLEVFEKNNGRAPRNIDDTQLANSTSSSSDTSNPPKRKRGRPRKSEQVVEVNTVHADSVPSTSSSSNSGVPMCQSNEPYENTYVDTNNMLKTSIMQIDILANDVKEEINHIKASKTLKGKYKYMSDLCATASSLVSTKLTAIREMNSVISKCHDLEIKRLKDIKAAQANQQDDDKYIADLYNAYINTPVNGGAMPIPFMNNTSANTTNNIGALMQAQSIGGNNEEQKFQEYLQNMTPEQNRMLLGDNPNIETVVVYDPNTGEKFFDVIDTSTGYGVNNYPRPDKILLDDTMIDFQTGMATNNNIGQSWKVVMSDQGNSMLNNF